MEAEFAPCSLVCCERKGKSGGKKNENELKILGRKKIQENILSVLSRQYVTYRPKVIPSAMVRLSETMGRDGPSLPLRLMTIIRPNADADIFIFKNFFLKIYNSNVSEYILGCLVGM